MASKMDMNLGKTFGLLARGRIIDDSSRFCNVLCWCCFDVADALLYSMGAIRPIRAGVKAPDAYWDRRLLLNLLLANAGLYFTALFTLIGAFLAGNTSQSAQLVLLLSLVVCLYSGVSVALLTPKDWPHTLPRILAAVFIGLGLLIR